MIQTEINRLTKAKADLKTSIIEKGVSVPQSALIDDYGDYIRAIEAGASDPTEFKYKNWIAYGLNTPDPSKYKYWVKADTTYRLAPIKQVGMYWLQDTFTGELKEEVFDLGEPTNNGYAANISGFMIDNVNPQYAIAGFSIFDYKPSASTTIRIYDISSTDNPQYYCVDSARALALVKVSDMGGTGQTYVKSTCFINNGKLYHWYIAGKTYVYDIATGNVTSYNAGPSSSTQVIIGAVGTSSTQAYAFAYSTSATGIIKVLKVNLTNFSYSTYRTLDTGSGHSFSGYQVVGVFNFATGHDVIVLAPSNNSISNTDKVYIFDLYTGNFAGGGGTAPTTYGDVVFYFARFYGAKKLCLKGLPSGKYWMLTQNSLWKEWDTTQYGNFFQSCLKNNIPSYPINVMEGFSSFSAEIDTKNYLLGNDRYDIYTPDHYSYMVVEASTTKNYSYGHEKVENIDSSHNVLITTEHNGSTTNSVVPLYLNENMDSFTFTRGTVPNAFYNKDLISIYISDGVKWSEVPPISLNTSYY